MRKIILLFSFFMLLTAATGAEDVLDMEYLPSGALAAIGGAHPAMIDGINTLFINPAGFRSVEKGEFSIAEITLGMHGPIFDIANLVIAASKGADIMTLLSENTDLITSLYAGIDLTGPIYFSYVGKGLGFGIFNNTDLTVETVGGMSVEATFGEQVYLAGGYAFRIPISEEYRSNLDIGMTLKASVRGELQLVESMFTLLSDFGSIDITTTPFIFSVGIGADVGLRLSVSDVFAFGLVAEDVFTPVFRREYDSLGDFIDAATPVDSNEILPIKLNTGFMISPPLGVFGRIISDIDLYFDFNNLLDFLLSPETSRNPILNLAYGINLSLLEIFSFRFGLYEGLFSAGLQLDLTIFKFNAAMYGTERGVEPGQNSVYNLIIGFQFRN
ncbi:MAG: hypothetical protein JW874_08285 [Spirochaetales bacterium]|nr:hypothetical protein [Spirochaetales bacterium]